MSWPAPGTVRRRGRRGKAELTAAEQEPNRYADQAMEALRKAVAGGWGNVPWIKNDPDLDALHGPALDKLLAEVEKQAR